MQTATCQEEMPSVQQVQQLSGAQGEEAMVGVSFGLVQELPSVCTKEWITRFGPGLTSLAHSQQCPDISEVYLTILVWAKDF